MQQQKSRVYEMEIHLTDRDKGLARSEVITKAPVRCVLEYIQLYDPEAFDRERITALRDEVHTSPDGCTTVFKQRLLGGQLTLSVAIRTYELTKYERFQEAFLEAVA